MVKVNKPKSECEKISTSLDLLKSADLFGKRFSFTTEGSSIHKTHVGALLGLIGLSFIVFGAIMKTSRYLDKSTPTSSISEKRSMVYPTMNLYDEGHVMGFGLYNASKGVEFINSTMTAPFATIFAYIYTYDYDQVTDTIPLVKTEIVPYVPCPLLNSTTIIEMIKKDRIQYQFFAYFGICPYIKPDVRERWIVGGDISKPPYNILQIAIYPCSLEDKSQCGSFRDIAQMKILLGVLYKIVDLTNKTEPISSKLSTDIEYPLNPTTTLKCTFTFSEQFIMDDDREFSDPYLKQRYVDQREISTITGYRDSSIYCTKEQILLGDCTPYLTIELKSDSTQITVNRTYFKVFELLSEIGGYLQVVVLLFELLYHLYNSYSFKKHVKSSILYYDEDILKSLFMFRKRGKQTIDSLQNEIIEKDFDALHLFEQLHSINISRQIIFEDYHMLLLPCVVMSLKTKGDSFRKALTSHLSKKHASEIDRHDGIQREVICDAYCTLKSKEYNDEFSKGISKVILNSLPRGLLQQLGHSEMLRKDKLHKKRILGLSRKVSNNMSLSSKRSFMVGSFADGRPIASPIKKQTEDTRYHQGVMRNIDLDEEVIDNQDRQQNKNITAKSMGKLKAFSKPRKSDQMLAAPNIVHGRSSKVISTHHKLSLDYKPKKKDDEFKGIG